jgi:hypothetical protein
MIDSRLLKIAAVVVTLIAASCGGTNDATGPPDADVTEEYTYVVADAGGTCNYAIGDSIGNEGVIRVTQHGVNATLCKIPKSCASPFCMGPSIIDGSSLVFIVSDQFTIEGCVYDGSYTVTLTRRDDGNLDWRQDWSYTSGTGTCDGHPFPCTMWQTRTTTKCVAPCYDSYCPSTLSKDVGAGGDWRD